MQKYKKAALSIAFLTMILSAGLITGYTAFAGLDGIRPNAKQEEKILTAFEDEDYDAWKKNISKRAVARSLVSKDDFTRFIDARKAARSGDYERTIRLSKKLELDLKNKLSNQLIF